MRILNICLTGPFSDGWNYQDNLLTKYQKKNGNDVTIIAPKWSWGKDGNVKFIDSDDYYNSDGVRIIRLGMKNKENINNRFKKYNGVIDTIQMINPDIIFVHGCQFLDIKFVIKYVKKHKVRLYVDNHADFSNSAKNWISKNILHGIIWKFYAKKIEPYVTKFYGVLPARVDFLNKIYNIPKNKIELLVMGADDEYIEKYCTDESYYSLRKKYKIKNHDFVIVTGGKIDYAKLQTITLMKTIRKMNNKNIKLFIFGSIDPQVKDEFDSLCSENIVYLGWADTKNSYEWFNMADLVAFPGRHSVYWEQVVAIGKPMICKYWDGTTHIDIGGNVVFLKDDSIDNLQKNIEQLLTNQQKFECMKKNAQKEDRKKFLYSQIARESVKKDDK